MSGIVTLNIGGALYHTTTTTLCRYPDSMLAALFKGGNRGRLVSGEMMTFDDKGRHFFDRDGSLFGYVLNFLRDSVLILPKDFKKLDMLEKEAKFYRLEPLVDAIVKARHGAQS